MSWINQPITAFDLETTGVSTEDDRVVTSTVLDIRKHVDGSETVTHSLLVNPGVEIPEAASAVHGVTTERARAEGLSPEVALPQIRDQLYAGWERGGPVVGFNLVFDLTMLDRELRRYGLGCLEIGGLVVDGLVLDKQLIPRVRGKGMRRLGPTCARWDITLTEEDAHTSDGDALAAARLVFKMAQRETLKHLSPAKLMENQKRWYREQALSFADWKARQGEHDVAAEIRATANHWPLAALPKPMESAPPPF